MKIFTVYVKKGEDIIESAKYVQEGFSFKALLFNIFWLMYHKLWIPFFITLLALITVAQMEQMVLISSTQNILISLTIFLYIGFSGRDFLRADLERKGYLLEDLVVASDIDDAELKFINSVFENVQNEIKEINE